MRRYQFIILLIGCILGAYWQGHTAGEDYAYLQFAELEMACPCSTDTECEECEECEDLEDLEGYYPK